MPSRSRFGAELAGRAGSSELDGQRWSRPSGPSRLHTEPPLANGEHRELGPAEDPVSSEEASEVALHRLDADPKPDGDLVVARAAGEEPDRVELAQARPARCVAKGAQGDIRKPALAPPDREDRIDDLLDRTGLGQVARGAAFEGCPQKARLIESAQDQHLWHQARRSTRADGSQDV